MDELFWLVGGIAFFAILFHLQKHYELKNKVCELSLKLGSEQNKSDELTNKLKKEEQKNDKLIDKMSSYSDNVVSIKKQFEDKKIQLKKSFDKQVEKIKSDCENKIKSLEELAENNKQNAEIYKAIYSEDWKKQDEQYKIISQKINQGKNIFITGGAGVGKSYIITKKLKKDYGKDIALTATTGVAAVNIGGMTIHSFCNMGIGELPVQQVVNSILNDEEKVHIKKTIRETKILCIDEISMMSWYILEYIDAVLKGVRESSQPFGGIQIIVVGDFLQLPPVNKRNEDCKYFSSKFCKQCFENENDRKNCEKRSFCFNSELFKTFEIVNLEEIKRQEKDKFFSVLLNRIRFGRSVKGAYKIFTEKQVIISNDEAEQSNIIHLYPTNKDCMTRNTKKIDKLKGDYYTYESVDTFEPEEGIDVFKSNEEIKKVLNDTICPETLRLKKDCRVMLIYNLDVSKGMCNGAIGTIKELDKKTIKVEFDNGEICDIERLEFKTKDHDGEYIRTQIPLIPAYAITIHKSQGLSLEKAMIKQENCFASGQTYVALSRLTTLSGLKIIGKFNHTNVLVDKSAVDFYLKNGIYE